LDRQDRSRTKKKNYPVLGKWGASSSFTAIIRQRGWFSGLLRLAAEDFGAGFCQMSGYVGVRGRRAARVSWGLRHCWNCVAGGDASGLHTRRHVVVAIVLGAFDGGRWGGAVFEYGGGFLFGGDVYSRSVSCRDTGWDGSYQGDRPATVYAGWSPLKRGPWAG